MRIPNTVAATAAGLNRVDIVTSRISIVGNAKPPHRLGFEDGLFARAPQERLRQPNDSPFGFNAGFIVTFRRNRGRRAFGPRPRDHIFG